MCGNNSWGGNGCLWIILILIIFCCCGSGFNNDCGNDCDRRRNDCDNCC